MTGEQFEKYKGIFNNLTDKEIIIPGLMIAEPKKDKPGASKLAAS